MLKWTFCYNYQPLDKTFQYVYNEIGNISSVTSSGNTINFGYTDITHPDRLTSYNNKAITYNANGGVASYDGWNYTWNDGKLTTIKKTTGSSSRAIIAPVLQPSRTYSYSYNGFGQRTRSQYSYFWNNNGLIPVQQGDVTNFDKQYTYDHSGRLVCEDISKTLYSLGTESSKIVYLYDENGVVGVQYTKGSTSNTYYFQRNLLGDVVAIYDTNGNKVVEYTYDAYGNCTIKGTTTNYDLAHANPIRYRGYYYDEDTKLYYLNARYYSPEFRRFISPDDTAYLNPENVNGLNLYCYCGNDPINFVDSSGHSMANTLINSNTAKCIAGKLHSLKSSEFNLFGAEWRTSAGWENSSNLITSWVGRIGFSKYVTKTQGQSGMLYAFAGSTSDVMNWFDTTYYAGLGINLFDVIALEVQLETVGIGAQVSIGNLSIGANLNLIGGTSITIGLDRDLGDGKTRTKGYTIGINTGLFFALLAWVYKVFTTGDPSTLPI